MNQRHPRPDILRLLERQARHGLTYRQLSEESGIPIPTLTCWASKQRRGKPFTPPRAHFAPIEVLEDDNAGAIVTELGPSVRVAVERGFDDEHLARVRTRYALEDEVCICEHCGGELHEIGEQVTREFERLESAVVHEFRRAKYAAASAPRASRAPRAPTA